MLTSRALLSGDNLRIHVPNVMVCFSIHIKPMPGYLVLLIGILYYLVTNKNNYYMTNIIVDLYFKTKCMTRVLDKRT
jgi:hypothetical protein